MDFILLYWAGGAGDNCGGEEGRDQQIKLNVKHTHILRSFCIHQFVYLSLLFTIFLLVEESLENIWVRF